MLCRQKQRFLFLLIALFLSSASLSAQGLSPTGQKRLIELTEQLKLEAEVLKAQSEVILKENETLRNSIKEAQADLDLWRSTSENLNQRLETSERQRIALEESLEKWKRYSVPVIAIETLVIIGLILLF